MSEVPRLLLTLEELAVSLGVARSTVYAWLNSGDLPLPVLRVGKSPRVRVADVESFLAQQADEARERRDKRENVGKETLTPAVALRRVSDLSNRGRRGPRSRAL